MSNYTIGMSAGRGWVVRLFGALVYRCETEREAKLTVALLDCATELLRLRDVHLPRFEQCIGEPDLFVLTAAQELLAIVREGPKVSQRGLDECAKCGVMWTEGETPEHFEDCGP